MFSLQLPINPTSLGQVSTNFLYEVFKRELEPNIFPIGGVDLTSFNGLLPEEFNNWLQNCANKALKDFSRNDPALRLWHIQGSHETVSRKNFLYFFHELDTMTPYEVNTLNSFDKTFSPCKFTEDVGEEYGVENLSTIQLGYNNLAFKHVDVPKYEGNPIVVALAGKFEKRKRTDKMIHILAKKYGGDRRFKLHLHVFNPFYEQKQEGYNQHLIKQACGGEIPWNFVIMPHMPLLSDLNKAYNMADVVVDGSGGESWSLPSFHMCGLGKQCVVHHNSGTKEWANENNSQLIKPNTKLPAEDGIFFGRDTPFNCGNIYDFDAQKMSDAIDLTVKNAKIVNLEGEKLPSQFTNDSFCEKILEEMGI